MPSRAARIFDGVDDVGGGERAHHVAARLVLHQQAFLREERQSLTDRGARHAQHLRQRGFRDTLPGRKGAAQDHLADANHRFGELAADGH